MPTSVQITPDVMSACWSHALSNEKEEVMGLLLGTMDDVDQDKLNVLSLKMIRRLTKQKDRVEIDNIYLTQASEHAEQLGLRVLGWYHSHPHITVHPSHVDLATQLGYQYMDSNFVGLIFSVFNYDPTTGVDTKEVIAFQSVQGDSGTECRYLPLTIGCTGHSTKWISSVNEALASLSDILMEEEKEEYNKAASDSVIDQLHNKSVLVARLTENCFTVTEPVVEVTEAHEDLASASIEQLKIERELLKKLIEEMN